MFDESAYRKFFRHATGRDTHEYQVRVARQLMGGRSVVLRAPTGAGKTWSVLVPFFYPDWQRRPTRLIYALPLRTLAQGIYREARETAQRLGRPIEAKVNTRGREHVSPYCTLQTGEQPDDRFFDRGRIVVTTYDQLLSGLLDQPTGFPKSTQYQRRSRCRRTCCLRRVSSDGAAPGISTAVAGLHLFSGLCQSVWMTATATRPLVELVGDATGAVPIPESEVEWKGLWTRCRA